MFFDSGGVSRPTSVAADAIRLTPPVPSAAGTSDRYENSFFHFTSRRRLMPHVCGPLAAVAQRLEGDRHLHRPALLEAAGLDVPDAVPRRVLQVVGHRHVAQRAERIGLEQVAVAAIVERVDDEREVLVAEDVAVVAAQLVGDLAFGMAVPAARRDIEVVVVEEDPRLGLLGGGLALLWFLLDEVGQRRDERRPARRAGRRRPAAPRAGPPAPSHRRAPPG